MNKNQSHLSYPYYTFFRKAARDYYSHAQSSGSDNNRFLRVESHNTISSWFVFQIKRGFQMASQLFSNTKVAIYKGWYYSLSAGAYGLAYLALLLDVPMLYLKKQGLSYFQVPANSTKTLDKNGTLKNKKNDPIRDPSLSQSALKASPSQQLHEKPSKEPQVYHDEPIHLGDDVLLNRRPREIAIRETIAGKEDASFALGMDTESDQNIEDTGPNFEKPILLPKETDPMQSHDAEDSSIFDESLSDFDRALDDAVKIVIDHAVFSENFQVRYIKQEDQIHFLSVRNDMRYSPKNAHGWKNLMIPERSPYFFCVQDQLTQINKSFQLDPKSLPERLKILASIDRLDQKGYIQYKKPTFSETDTTNRIR